MIPTISASRPKCLRKARSVGVAIARSPSQFGKKTAILMLFQDTGGYIPQCRGGAGNRKRIQFPRQLANSS